MPATYAHFKYGKLVYRALPRKDKKVINMSRGTKAAYLIGLHGPDLLFYYRCVSFNRINRLGRKMHRTSASEFFEHGRDVYRESRDPVLLSYLCGFMCHFILDSECHPYINMYAGNHDVGHLGIETDFDRALMEADGLDPLRHDCTGHLKRNPDVETAISSVMDDVSPQQVDTCIRWFRLVIRFFQCPHALKGKILKRFTKLIGQKDSLGGLVMTGVPDQECANSRVFLENRLKDSVKTGASEISKYLQAVKTGGTLSTRLDRDFD